MSRVARLHDGLPKVYYGAPGWSNYENVFRHAGFQVEKLPYYDFAARDVSFQLFLDAVRRAPEHSIIILQGCCQNPTAADMTRAQWKDLADVMKSRSLFPFFDSAYYGLGDGLDEDSFSWRMVVDMGFEMIVCQSFSKNFGLYGERVGALHVVCPDEVAAARVKSELFRLIRCEYSTNPLFGARLVSIILGDPVLRADWEDEVTEIRARLKSLRSSLVRELKQLQVGHSSVRRPPPSPD